LKQRLDAWIKQHTSELSPSLAENLLNFFEQDNHFRSSGPKLREFIEVAISSLFGENADNTAIGKFLEANNLLWLFTALHDQSIQVLLPGKVSSLDSLMFIPRAVPPPTRYIGSWVRQSNFFFLDRLNLFAVTKNS
jgi:hypothetical protein